MRFDPARATLHEVLERNRLERPFLIARDAVLSYRDASLLTAGFAEFLLASGVRRGDRVCLLLPRTPELILGFLGAVRIGAIPVPVNYMLTGESVRRFLAAAAPAATVVHERALKHHGIATALCHPGPIVVVGKEHEGWVPWGRACFPSTGQPSGGSGFDETAYLNYTTGSSGSPKGALTSHANIAWNTRSAVEAFDITGEDVHLCMFASFAHPHELFARALYTGGSTVLLEEINPRTIARTIRDQGVTCMMGLAPMYDMLRAHCAAADLGQLRIAESGGMYTRPDIAEGFQRHFGLPVLSVWGSTETTGIALANTPEGYRTDGSAGRVCPYYDARVVGEDGRDVGDGEIGELYLSGPGVVSSYRENVPFPSLDGWYRSGDLVRRDADGYHYFVERVSGLLKVAGMKVYPLQIELVIQTHPAVREVAVVGVEDRVRGVVSKAFLVAKAGCRIDADEIRRFCRHRLADYLIPREIQVVGDLPRIGSGKVDKKQLRRGGEGARA